VADGNKNRVATQVRHTAKVDEAGEEFPADQPDRYEGQFPDDPEEGVSRVLILIVPIVHGGLVGGAADNMLLGLSAGMALSAGLDLCMGRDSMVRSLARRLTSHACPAIAATLHLLATGLARLGLADSASLRSTLCKGYRSE
jgi:hypothetical protein